MMNTITKFLPTASLSLFPAVYSDVQITGQINFGKSVLENRSISITAGATTLGVGRNDCLVKVGTMTAIGIIHLGIGISSYGQYPEKMKA